MMRPTVFKIACTLTAFTLASASSYADLTSYGQDFEGLDQSSMTALSDDGWVVFANIFAPDGSYINGYGGPAPNVQGEFTAYSFIIAGQGGPTQGDQQLGIVSDYFNTEDQKAGNLIEANVYQEQVVAAGDAGTTWYFSFDAKRGFGEFAVSGDTTAFAFIRVLDSLGGTFQQLANQTVDTTMLPEDWRQYTIDLTIDGAWAGQLLQFGFLTNATNFEPSLVIYDNLSFQSVAPEPDFDTDGVPNSTDNCTEIFNVEQLDTDADGFGNACDADLDGDCFVGFPDLQAFAMAFGSSGKIAADFDGDNFVGFPDLTVFVGLFGGAPGPSGQPTNCN